jgi:hypothetical protein
MNDKVEESVPSPSGRPRVILLLLTGPPLRALALALAARGATLALWPAGAPNAPDAPGADEALLECQAAVEYAGGISLAAPAGARPGGAAALEWVIESFGHLDAVVCADAPEARLLAPALATLAPEIRPRRLILTGPPLAAAIAPAQTAPLTEWREHPRLRSIAVEAAPQDLTDGGAACRLAAGLCPGALLDEGAGPC